MRRFRRSPRTRRVAVAAAAAAALVAAAPPGDEPGRLRWLGETRHIAVHAPPAAGGELPLLLVLGEPGRAARYALKSWREVADRERFVVAVVASHDPRQWRAPQDGPGFLRAVVRHVGDSHRVDPRRVYLFGYGHASGFAVAMAMLQPRYFAAVGCFGGNPRLAAPGPGEPLERALPVRVYFSEHELQFDVDALQQGAAALRQQGAEVEVTRLGIGTDFERRGRRAAGRIWQELSAQALSEPGRYQSTRYDR